MDTQRTIPFERVSDAIERDLAGTDVALVAEALEPLSTSQVVQLLERLDPRRMALAYRLLPKQRAVAVFERLDAAVQGDLVGALQDEDVAAVFGQMEPDDRAVLLDELPASVASRLMQGLPRGERELTAVVLGYPERSIGRRMSPEVVSLQADSTASQAMERIRTRFVDAETVYTLPVVDQGRCLVGIADLRDLMAADDQAPISELMAEPIWVTATESAEGAARLCADTRLLALPVVDAESRLVGILTVDDALAILEEADSEDQARISGSEPLRRPYLATPVRSIVRSRVVWLLVLAIGATLTVQVLEVFEDTLAQMVVLSVFVPLLIGTGGNTGNQAATTVTRALALGDVRPRDVLRVALREVRVGITLGVLLGVLGFLVASAFYGMQIGAVIGLTLLSICTLAATLGGVMPLIGRLLKVDPAVFANPFITTIVDATGLIIYFLIARAVLGL